MLRAKLEIHYIMTLQAGTSVPPPKSAGKPSSPTGEDKEVSPVPSSGKEISVRLHELVKVVKIPEKMAEEVKLSAESAKILAGTLVSHYKWVDGMADKAVAGDMHNKFYEQFGRVFQGRNLKDKDELEKCAREFLQRGGEETRLTIKLAEWEAATLQAATKRLFVEEKKASQPKSITATTKVKAEGGKVTTTVKEKKKWEGRWGINIRNLGLFIRRASEYKLDKLDGETSVVIAGLTPVQEKFINAGWPQGNLNIDQLIALDTRLVNIMSVRGELLAKTGYRGEFDPNFIDANGNYQATKVAHFLNEVGAATAPQNIVDLLETEGIGIAGEVKTKVEKELREAMEKRVDETTQNRLDKAITAIKEEAQSPDQIVTRKLEIQAEIRKLKKKLELFTRKARLGGVEIPEADAACQEARLALERYVQTKGYTVDQIIKLGGDETVPESWRHAEKEYKDLMVELGHINGQIEGVKKRFEAFQQVPPTIYTTKTYRTDGTLEREEPDPALAAEIRIDYQGTRALSAKIDVNPWGTSGKTLSQLIGEKEAEYKKKQKIVEEDPEMKRLLDAFTNAQKDLERNKAEETNVDKDIAGLPAGQNTGDYYRQEIKKLEEKEKNVGNLDEAKQAEVDSLTAIKVAFGTAEQKAREERIAAGNKLALEYADSFKDYPNTVLRFVQLVWGEDVLQPYPPEELAKQVKALLHSPTYLKMIVGAVEDSFGIAAGDKVIFPIQRVVSGNTVDIDVYNDSEITNMFSGKDIFGRDFHDMTSRDVVKKILQEMRIKALATTFKP